MIAVERSERLQQVAHHVHLYISYIHTYTPQLLIRQRAEPAQIAAIARLEKTLV